MVSYKNNVSLISLVCFSWIVQTNLLKSDKKQSVKKIRQYDITIILYTEIPRFGYEKLTFKHFRREIENCFLLQLYFKYWMWSYDVMQTNVWMSQEAILSFFVSWLAFKIA